ncbi:MAG: nicotinate phosphoribosyltransferase [Acidobacteria bacterium]|nr:nicotinate phosphoribosyltransferase [Acidobacteriota bacterium]
MRPSDRATAEGLLFTDLYQLTMAQLYFRRGLHENLAQFDCFFRTTPHYGEHQAGYCVNAGLEWFISWLQQARAGDADIARLATMTGRGGRPLFGDDFLRWLRSVSVVEGMNITAIPEGRVVHPDEPLLVVRGPLAAAQLVETACLNQVCYQTLVATKAARVRDVARGGTVLEFGMRRAHATGANAGARAALIGGADFTSNTGISLVLGYPPKGTHAHSMVQAYMALGEGELGAFRAFAELYPDDCLLLVDTIDTLGSGVPNAIRVFEELRRAGHRPLGIRLDSGDLAYLSIQAARMLDDAGFPETSIVLSNQLDELLIWQILTQIGDEAPRYGVDAERLIARLVYGVGTRLVTSRGDSALDGVFKLVGLHAGGTWLPAIKLSETSAKTINPGYKPVWRAYDLRGRATADILALEDEDPRAEEELVLHHTRRKSISRRLSRAEITEMEPLLVEVLRDGKPVYEFPGIEQMRELRASDMSRLDPGVKRLMNPHIYHVSLTEKLWRYKEDLVASVRGSL